mmetsp:Transcript_25833/g.51831  ORF Transcript_25833/g.51831 Transcript_25833/m.51831 type:complete len:205 (-) Transcript_25833:36-650(-)
MVSHACHVTSHVSDFATHRCFFSYEDESLAALSSKQWVVQEEKGQLPAISCPQPSSMRYSPERDGKGCSFASWRTQDNPLHDLGRAPCPQRVNQQFGEAHSNWVVVPVIEGQHGNICTESCIVLVECAFRSRHERLVQSRQVEHIEHQEEDDAAEDGGYANNGIHIDHVVFVKAVQRAVSNPPLPKEEEAVDKDLQHYRHQHQS